MYTVQDNTVQSNSYDKVAYCETISHAMYMYMYIYIYIYIYMFVHMII